MLTGLLDLPWWGYVLATLGLTHITIAAVTLYLHRHQAHRAFDMHPVVSHFFRFWLWLTTGMVTREWVAIHRKHHASSDKPGDPHSPVVYGIRKVLFDGIELYRRAAKDRSIIDKHGHGAPADWIERHLYARHTGLGLALMFLIDIVLFGPIGITVWAVQMMWIPFFAAGVINGLAHYWGYRNFEVPDTSTNICPVGILIGGEEMHNNHHTFGSSAKFSSTWWEFDIGWMYIRLLETIGLARVKKIPPELVFNADKDHIDIETVRAVITNRFQLMAHFAREVLHRVHREELQKLDRSDKESWKIFKRTRRLLAREPMLLDERRRRWLDRVLNDNTALNTVYAMREKLQDTWRRSATTQEHLRHALEEWCRQAEASGIEALHRFARKVRMCSMTPVPA